MVILRDASYADVEGLVRYVYRGEVDVEPDRLQAFLRTAELLKIKGLADQNLSSSPAAVGAPSPNGNGPATAENAAAALSNNNEGIKKEVRRGQGSYYAYVYYFGRKDKMMLRPQMCVMFHLWTFRNISGSADGGKPDYWEEEETSPKGEREEEEGARGNEARDNFAPRTR